jgi:hypothetical protein
MDAEWLALRTGVKPAIQRGAPGAAEASEMAARFVAEGFAVARADSSTGSHILYIAARQDDADALRDAEADLLRREAIAVEREAAALEEVGRRLGYPECCVARRVARNRARRKIKLQQVPHEDYRGAVDAWTERPAWELNRFALPREAFLITFEPCSYGCPTALALARRTLDFVSREFPEEVAPLIETLRRPFVVGRGHEEGAYTVLDRSGATPVVIEAVPLWPAATTFAAGLRGRAVGRRGAVGEALLLDFGSCS